MPGIAGFIGDLAPAARRQLCDEMRGKLRHEDFYMEGCHVDDALGLAVGWCGLPSSFAAQMPVWNEDHTVCLIFFGEEYSDRSEAAGLRARGHSCLLEDSSYLVHLYEELGDAFLARINGGFCGLLVDQRGQSVTLFNDRYGLNRVYYHQNAHGFYFASEAKSLLTILPECRDFDSRGLGEFLACGCALQNRTLFAGIRLLDGASRWVFRDRRLVRREVYFRASEWEAQPALGEREYEETLQQTWARILPNYLRGTVALSLTGGVDSRMILAWAPRIPGSLPCYTFGGIYRDCADVTLARAIAHICQQQHHVIPLAPDFFSNFPTLAARTVYISDGSMDVTGAVDLYVQRQARPIAPVRVTGTNGGEILRRLVAFKPTTAREHLLPPDVAELTRVARVTYAEEVNGTHRLSFTAFKQTPWYMCSKFAVEKSQLTLRMPYFDNELVALSYRAPASIADSNRPALRLIAAGNPSLQTVGTDRGVRSRSLAHGLPAAHWFQQFTFKAEYAYDYGMPQWLARVDHACSRLHVERLFLGRHKFHHFRVFYRDRFANFVREILLDPATLRRPYLSPRNIERVVSRHLAGTGNHTLELHALLTLELIQRQLLEQN